MEHIRYKEPKLPLWEVHVLHDFLEIDSQYVHSWHFFPC